MTARTVWLVGGGEYSDYGIAAVFSNKAAGERYVRIKNGDGDGRYSGPDEYIVLDEVPEPQDYLTVKTRVGRNTRGEPQETMASMVPGVDGDDFELSVNVAVHGVNAVLDIILVTVSGFEFDYVRKVSSERTAHAVANFDLLIEQEKARLGKVVPR